MLGNLGKIEKKERGRRFRRKEEEVYIKEVAVYAEASSATRLGPSPSLAVASWALGLNAARPAILAPMIAKKGKLSKI